MIIARQKRKENIVEYLLYMWQVEDLIRACKFDMELIEKQIISQYDQPEEVKQEIRKWYGEQIDMMRQEGVTEHDHIQINKNVVGELTELHLQLLNTPEETVYKSLYYKTLPSIVHLRSKSGGNEVPEIETCLTAVYGFLLLKLQSREISEETANAVKLISTFLAFLAAKYKESCSN
ncbi:MAG: DUF4924 family protein [Tannerella sp.]|jgi:hypothetical protein|nr:DUF4924 family protein [Tannerella sp.]